mmetsp:Transcript_7961/g.31430  ORF Transcript_7961/g.31430 Transcript_7961/m.31430 type:complete len:258 (+) Transcript_7961:248-1021(+)
MTRPRRDVERLLPIPVPRMGRRAGSKEQLQHHRVAPHACRMEGGPAVEGRGAVLEQRADGPRRVGNEAVGTPSTSRRRSWSWSWSCLAGRRGIRLCCGAFGGCHGAQRREHDGPVHRRQPVQRAVLLHLRGKALLRDEHGGEAARLGPDRGHVAGVFAAEVLLKQCAHRPRPGAAQPVVRVVPSRCGPERAHHRSAPPAPRAVTRGRARLQPRGSARAGGGRTGYRRLGREAGPSVGEAAAGIVSERKGGRGAGRPL